MDPPEQYDHVRVDRLDHPEGIYRVVGVAAESVTLLRVGDGDGRRVNTGAVIRVGAEDIAALEPARNPDGNRPLAERLSRVLDADFWSGRTVVTSAVRNPVPTSVFAVVMLAGLVGERVTGGPEIVFDLLVLLGAIGLAAVGSGRFTGRALQVRRPPIGTRESTREMAGEEIWPRPE